MPRGQKVSPLQRGHRKIAFLVWTSTIFGAVVHDPKDSFKSLSRRSLRWLSDPQELTIVLGILSCQVAITITKQILDRNNVCMCLCFPCASVSHADDNATAWIISLQCIGVWCFFDHGKCGLRVLSATLILSTNSRVLDKISANLS